MEPSSLDKIIAEQAKKGKKKYFIEKDLIAKGYEENEIKQALHYASIQKKAFGKKLLIGGLILFAFSIVMFIVKEKVTLWSLLSFMSACFAIYDGYTKIKNYDK